MTEPYSTLIVSASALIVMLALIAFVFALYLHVRTLALLPTLLFQSKQTQMALAIAHAQEKRAEEEPETPTVTEEVPRYADQDFIRGIEAQRAARQTQQRQSEPANVLAPEDLDGKQPAEEFAPGGFSYYAREQ